MFVLTFFLIFFNLFLYLRRTEFQIQLLSLITMYIFYLVNIFVKLIFVYFLVLIYFYCKNLDEDDQFIYEDIDENKYLKNWERFTKNVIGYTYDEEPVLENN